MVRMTGKPNKVLTFDNIGQVYKWYTSPAHYNETGYIVLNGLGVDVNVCRKDYLRLRMDPCTDKEYRYFNRLVSYANEKTTNDFLFEVHLT